MKIGILIPTQGNRPNFLSNVLRYANSQTRKADKILVNNKGYNLETDLTIRVKEGLQELSKEVDWIFIFEDDDYYAPNYIESYLDQGLNLRKIKMIGQSRSLYYHLFERKWKELIHHGRSSLFQTAINSKFVNSLNFGKDEDVNLDMRLWQDKKDCLLIEEMSYKEQRQYISIGIKHGLGLCGGVGHIPRKMKYENNDDDYQFLRSVVGDNNLENYCKIIERKEP
jgi:hypothetical protein